MKGIYEILCNNRVIIKNNNLIVEGLEAWASAFPGGGLLTSFLIVHEFISPVSVNYENLMYKANTQIPLLSSNFSVGGGTLEVMVERTFGEDVVVAGLSLLFTVEKAISFCPVENVVLESGKPYKFIWRLILD